MSLVTTPPSSPCAAAPGSCVVDAARRFQERRLPAGAAVQHPCHGHGVVAAAIGTRRLVDFQHRVCMPAEQLDPDEWPCLRDVDIDVEHVAWIEGVRLEVEVAELQAAALAADDPGPAEAR